MSIIQTIQHPDGPIELRLEENVYLYQNGHQLLVTGIDTRISASWKMRDIVQLLETSRFTIQDSQLKIESNSVIDELETKKVATPDGLGIATFGAAAWSEYFGEVGPEPKLPKDGVEVSHTSLAGRKMCILEL